ncbi:hypothetical protein GCM10011515_07140 [Tsuneonella deserti]|uniref:Mitochondrial inner membrane protein n=1 Tax=Tsuneonella deserti TaxID=2035528 RepID=A0ABQ1S1Y3_9SPHN|nr:hypothetical protein [Tsuneonella deserti]GGD90108.1 hypothetical protein GCM10011515_07140 [Tsuneonella deserti]
MDQYTPASRQGSSLKPVLLAVLASFLLGASAVGYLAWRGFFTPAEHAPQGGTGAASPSLLDSPTPEPTPSPSETARAAAVARVEETQGGIEQRLAAAEQRIARLDLQAQAAGGNAARAEGLLIAFATRRALERGAELGYLGDQLRLRFGDAQPNSVQTVLDFAKDPVTRDVLLARLDGLQPSLQAGSGRPTLGRLRDELAGLFVIRRETTPSPQPARRFERARMFLETGRVDKAIAEVQMLPGSDSAADWIANARRFERAQRALDLIETAAVQEPRMLRNGAGQPVEQLSPAATPVTAGND